MSSDTCPLLRMKQKSNKVIKDIKYAIIHDGQGVQIITQPILQQIINKKYTQILHWCANNVHMQIHSCLFLFVQSFYKPVALATGITSTTLESAMLRPRTKSLKTHLFGVPVNSDQWSLLHFCSYAIHTWYCGWVWLPQQHYSFLIIYYQNWLLINTYNH